MTINVKGESPFQVLANAFGVSASDSGYKLAYSADGFSYTDWKEATPAGEVLFVNANPKGAYFKLVGNTSNVTVTY